MNKEEVILTNTLTGETVRCARAGSGDWGVRYSVIGSVRTIVIDEYNSDEWKVSR